MSNMSQKEAVRQALANVCGVQEVYAPSKEERAQVNAILFEGFKSGKIEIKVEKTDTDLKGYVSGLQSNWLRKDKELNGGIQYVPKNPGSRAGSADPQLKAMRALLTTLTDATERAEVQSFINARVSEIGATKQAKTVDFSQLPDDLKAKYQK